MVRCLSNIDNVSVVATAESIAETEQLIGTLQPDLLVLDLSLPDGNSAERIQQFKALAPQMDIAIHTNDATEFTRRKCLEHGANWFFDKSGELEDLLELVHLCALEGVAF